MEIANPPAIFDELLDFLASSPSQAEILEYKASDELQARLGYLLHKNRNDGLSSEENAELDEILRLDHFVTMLKIRVRKKLMAKSN